MKKIKKTLKIISLSLVVLFSLVATGVSAVDNNNDMFGDERSWSSDSVKVEADSWDGEIEKWNKAIEKWDEKREEMHDKYFDDKYDDRARYCNSNGECWEEGMFEITYKINNTELKFRKKDCDVRGSDEWECRNSGQSIEFKKDDVFFESRNHGQSLVYKDSKKSLESRNHGQSMVFKDSSGNIVESRNHGQSLEDKNSKGDKFESRNYGQSHSN